MLLTIPEYSSIYYYMKENRLSLSTRGYKTYDRSKKDEKEFIIFGIKRKILNESIIIKKINLIKEIAIKKYLYTFIKSSFEKNTKSSFEKNTDSKILTEFLYETKEPVNIAKVLVH